MWIIHQSGIPVFHDAVEKIEIDKNLFGGFLSAIISLASNVLQGEFNKLKMSGGELHYRYKDDYIIVLYTPAGAESDTVSRIFDFIEDSFWDMCLSKINGSDPSFTESGKFDFFIPLLREFIFGKFKEHKPKTGKGIKGWSAAEFISKIKDLITKASEGTDISDEEIDVLVKMLKGIDRRKIEKTLGEIDELVGKTIKDERLKVKFKRITAGLSRHLASFVDFLL